MRAALTALLATLAFVVAAPSAQAQVAADGSPAAVKDWDVYVDLPTGFAFVKTPQRWVFVRQLDAEQLARLHPSVLVSLLPADEMDGTRFAALTRGAATPSAAQPR